MVRILMLVALMFPTTAFAQTVKCNVAKKFVCGASTGCKPVESTITIMLDLSRQTYSRCDAKGCDTWDARISKSGIFFVIDLPGRGTMAKMADDSSTFLEVATIMDSVLVSFGACQ